MAETKEGNNDKGKNIEESFEVEDNIESKDKKEIEDEGFADNKSYREKLKDIAKQQPDSETLQEIEKISKGVKGNTIVSKEQFDDPNFKANFGTSEQIKRDEQITLLLTKYVNNYSDKIENNKDYKAQIFTVCESIIVMYALVIPFAILYICNSRKGSTITGADVAALLSVCISFLGLIIGLMQIITKYVFPEKEEEYITQIVRAIQENDLKHKKQNMKYMLRADSDLDDKTKKEPVEKDK